MLPQKLITYFLLARLIFLLKIFNSAAWLGCDSGTSSWKDAIISLQDEQAMHKGVAAYRYQNQHPSGQNTTATKGTRAHPTALRHRAPPVLALPRLDLLLLDRQLVVAVRL